MSFFYNSSSFSQPKGKKRDTNGFIVVGSQTQEHPYSTTQTENSVNSVINKLNINFLIVNLIKNTFYCCIYQSHSLKLIFMEPIRGKNNRDLVINLIQQFEPELCVTTNKVKISLGLESNQNSNTKFQIKPTKEFISTEGQLFLDSFEKSLEEVEGSLPVKRIQRFICQLRISEDFLNYLTLLSVFSINIEIICEQQRRISKTDIIKTMEFAVLNGYLFIDANSRISLKLISNIHTSVESSITQLFGKCYSKIGNALLNQYLLLPLTDAKKIKNRHDAISNILLEYELGKKQSIIGQITDCISGVSDINAIIQKLKVGNYDEVVWKQLRSMFYNITKMKELIESSDILLSTDCFLEFIESLKIDEIYMLDQLLKTVIDFDTDPKSICIQTNYDSTLQSYKHIYDEMEGILSRKAFELKAQTNLDLVIAYIPQFGYLLAVDREDLASISVKEFDLIFTTSTTYYYKTKILQDMDAEYGDLYSMIRDKETEILYTLQDKLFEYGLDNLTAVYQHIGEIDVMICFALVSFKNGFVKPILIPEEHGMLDLKESFHPLYKKSSFICNDFKITNSKVIVITGPNYSGKSTLLAQLGITVYLSQIGCFIPARSGKLSVFMNILTRINTLESVNINQSTFMKDCQQMSDCINKSNIDSLVLIDEFGKGTDINDGPGLFGSTLKLYLNRGDSCPLVLLSTHTTEVFQPGIIEDIIGQIDFKQMAIIIENENLFKLTFLYQLLPGLAETSAGLYCARKSGIALDVVKKAQFILNLIKRGQNIVNEFTKFDDEELLVIEEHKAKIKMFLELNFQEWHMKNHAKLKTEILKVLNA